MADCWENSEMEVRKIITVPFEEYLESMIGKQNADKLLNMSQQEKRDQTIIITGIQGSTGKTTLKNVLRKHGYRTLESYECIELSLCKKLQYPIADFTCFVD